MMREGEMGWTFSLHSKKESLERIESMKREGRERWNEKWREGKMGKKERVRLR